MKASELRKSILQVAVQGKLVPQDKNDEPASELLKRIQAEKDEHIKAGKLKRGRPLPPITGDEIPYDLPEGWVWCRLNNFCDVRDGTHDTPKYVSDGFPLITSKNLSDGQISFENVKLISNEDFEAISQRSKVDIGDILFAMIGSIGNPAVVESSKPFAIKNVALFKPYRQDSFITKYFFYFLELEQEQMKRISSGGVQSFVSLNFLRNYLIPVPPLAEQQRIASKVDELMALCDELEAAENEQDALEKHLAEDLPESILQSAVQGKLVPQDKNDEPASELLKRIQAEKTALIKAGKLKKEKPLPPITEDEIPYNLPDGWVWCRLGEVNNFIMGQSPAGNSVSTDNQGLEFHQGKSFYGEKYLQKSNQFTSSPSKIAPPNSILLAVRAPVGDVNIAKREICIGRGLCAVRPLGTININFMFYWLQAQKQNFVLKATGTTFAAITGEVVKNQLLPLPPLAEQQRITAKVDELMTLCNELKQVGDLPIDYSNVVPFPDAVKTAAERVAMAARGNVNNLSAQAKQAIEDLFAEDE
ncbi:Type I restriction modification DNA specificity domain protein [Caprobacter fermentans]|uniref:Type I restriction modification DNA specificity domain protein n=1 Tax=Caproicibacter fermentans TaxID=2576756 RepID=A0A6N8HV35_9FIRM|nr:restriction endonuclease subunit S [Caproicibacter fermentans]MVB09487.1 Type I restriction modification DNA specificity domain protein [Caproicibacter fermentans]